MRVDAHHHLWDTRTRDYPWMDGPWADPIRGRFDTASYSALAREHGVDASVVVQAAPELAETRELLAATDRAGVVRRVVGWADLTAPDVADTLAALRDEPGGHRLAGIRHPVENEADNAWLSRADVQAGIAAVGAAGLVYDLLVKPPQLAAAVRTVRDHPEVTFVLDHLGKPAIAAGVALDDEPWAGHLAALAAAPNVTAKLSGLVTEADWSQWRPEHLAPFARRALELFGPDRVMFGSDWPVCTLAASYHQVVHTTSAALAGLSAAETAAVWGGTAARVYGIAA